jgi:hypothetical protein
MKEILEYRDNPDGTTTVVVKGTEVGTFATRGQASDAVDAGITKGIKKLAERVGAKDEVDKILSK